MPRKIAVTSLNASTIDILNTIRANASMEYQTLVPQATSEKDIPRVGEVLYGYPALANQFISALVTRIALVNVRSANFNNMFAELKKGYLEFGEQVEEVFVSIAKAREFSVEKAESREFKRSIPDVRTAFHAMNYRVQYPVTIQDEDLRTAFLSMDGVQNLITRVVDSVYTANEYDEYLMFKYLMIKAITSGKMKPVSIGSGTDLKESAVQFRGMSNQLQFMSNEYNTASVHTTTPKADQIIFMDSLFNAQFDVNVLASAFNMEKADFMGRLKLIDSWNTFDNERFDVIRANSDMIDEVTEDELALMANVKAVLVDTEWFQFYDNNTKFTEKYVASGMYWNYFLNVWKTISSSPFSNAIVFVTDDASITPLTSVNVEVVGKDVSDTATVLTLNIDTEEKLVGGDYGFVQTETATSKGVAIHRFGAVIIPNTVSDNILLECVIGKTHYTTTTPISKQTDVGDTVTLTKTSTLTS